MLANTSFLKGLTQPSLLSVFMMLITCAICFGMVVLFPSVIFTKPVSHLFVDPKDHYYYVTANLIDLKRETSDGRPMFVIAGASVTQSSFGGTGKVSAALKGKFGQSFDVRLMTTGRQNLVEHFMIFESVPQDRPVFAVLGVGPSRFTWGNDEYLSTYANQRFGVSSPAYLAQLARLDPDFEPPSGSPLVQHTNFYVARTEDVLIRFARAVLGKASGRNQNQYIGGPVSDEAYRELATRVAERFHGAEDRIAFNHSLFRDLLAFIRSRGNIELVVMEHPIRPGFVSDFLGEEVYARHLADMKRITSEAGVSYLVANDETELSVDDFFDWAHIRTKSAQDQLRAAILEAF